MARSDHAGGLAVLSSSSFSLPPLPVVAFGVGSSSQVADQVRMIGEERAFLVADPGVVAAGLVGPLVDALRAAEVVVEVFDGVEPNPTDENVDAGTERLRAFGRAAVIVVGGGSAMDAGKCMALAAPNAGRGVDFAYHTRLDGDTIDFSSLVPPAFPEHDGYPVIAVPTTAGTASETNGAGVITDVAEGRKVTFMADSVKPKVVLLDPALTVGLPPVPTATCGMDALTHAIEAFTSQMANPYCDAVALGAIEMVAEWLPMVIDDPSNLEGRSQMLLASHMAGIAFSSGPLLGLVHACGHPLSGRLHQPHGQTLATMLPHVMAFNAEVCGPKYARVARAMGAGTEGGDAAGGTEAAIEAVRRLSERVGTARSVADLGGDESLVEVLVEDALADPVILTTPRPPSRQDVRDLYLAAMG
ncbi:MAG: iron-containing alcohol dehydrogenase [Acidimicrobiia bacterium]|nr:iron-containing alcohol dehydrogenase [Acidimicrobiia bacterium]